MNPARSRDVECEGVVDVDHQEIVVGESGEALQKRNYFVEEQ